MRLAAYRQYNNAIPSSADCFQTGKLKRGYGVEDVLKMLTKTGVTVRYIMLFWMPKMS